MALRERLKFLPNDDRSIDNGFALQLCLGMSCIQEHVTAAERKSNVQFTRQSVELVQTTVCYLEPIMEPNKKTSSKCGDVFHKGSSFLSFVSLLLIVALFLRMESINRKTEMNELRISKVESRVETESLQTTELKNDMETPESKYKLTLFHRYILQDSNREVFSNWTHAYAFHSLVSEIARIAGDTSCPCGHFLLIYGHGSRLQTLSVGACLNVTIIATFIYSTAVNAL